MAFQLEPPVPCSAAPAFDTPEPPLHGQGADVEALILRWRLDPTEFQVRVHELCDGGGFESGRLLVTVANRRQRASRTYLSRLRRDEWIDQFEQDLCAGVFSPRT